MQIASTALTDMAGNAYAGISNDTTLNFTTAAYTPGQSVISLGGNGQLVRPIQVEGKVYYVLDRNMDGNNGGTADQMSMDDLELMSMGSSTGTVITESNRTFSLNGVSLALPTDGLPGNTSNPPTGFKTGTAWSQATPGYDTDPNSNATYDDLLAIWDAYNGTLTTTGGGMSLGSWTLSSYWSATPSSAGHIGVALSFGVVGNYADTGLQYVALEVLPDTTAPTLVSSTPADNAISVSTTGNLSFTFSETILAGTGNITLRDITAGTSTTIVVTDSSQVSISGSTLTLNPSADLVGSHAYSVQIASTALTDMAGNAYAGISNDTTLNFTTAAYSPGQSVIALGSGMGQLIAPIQIEGAWYYVWDRNNDGVHNFSAGTGSYAGVTDTTSMDALELLTMGTSTGTVITESNRTFNWNGVTLELPTDGLPGTTNLISTQLSSTAWSTLTPGYDTDPNSNATYDDLTAIWDAYTGVGTGTGTVNGAPPNWRSSTYWSATPGSVGRHSTVSLHSGFVSGDAYTDDLSSFYVALKVLPDTTAPTLMSSTPADNATGVSTIGDLSFTFSENILAGTGNITLHDITAGTSTTIAVTDSSQVSINGSTLTLNPSAELVGNHAYSVQIASTALTDMAGNAYAGISNDTTLNFTTAAYTAGQSVINLDANGKLIAPIQVEGNWYYFWDRSDDGTSADTGSLNGGLDYVNHNVLDGLFNKDINGVTNTTVQNADGAYGTTDVYRYGTLNGVSLALPTYGGPLSGDNAAPPEGFGQQNGTSYNVNRPTGGGLGAQLNDATVNGNTIYNDLLAIWDGMTTVVSAGVSDGGTPLGWTFDLWSATPTPAGHATILFNYGRIQTTTDAVSYHVALQVL